MELETLIAHFMILIAVMPFIAMGLSKITESRRYKKLYNIKG